MAEHGPHEEIDLQVKAYSELKLTGFEDESTRRLIEARQFLRQSGMPSLRPILPALLNLKGKPYTLDDYFPFEPFFRTHMPKMLMLKTGRQVSKCCDVDALVLMADGPWKRAGLIRVGDMVVSWSPKQECFVVRRVTRIWQTGIQGVRRLITRSGLSVRVTPEHQLFGRGADNHIEAYCQAEWIYAGDYLATRTDKGDLRFDRVDKNFEDGVAETVDIEVDGGTGEEPNFVLNRIVSHNSTSLAAQGVVLSNSMPHRSTLYVTPLFEMIRRFSHNYVRKFIEDSPVKRLFISQNTTNQILQRSFINGASMYFSYAFLDADRTRGIPADINCLDEVQDLNFDFLQIIHETLSGSNLGLKRYAGTPKSLDNTVEKLWSDSSQAEWVIRCTQGGCNYFNVPTLTHDLYDMIDTNLDREISERSPGVVCAKCRKPLSPRNGHWIHAYEDRRWTFAGYHVPQIIMPLHYADKDKWTDLVGKMRGEGNTTQTTFLNEVCGESSDAGSKLVTVTDLKNAAVLPWPNQANEAVKHINRYRFRILAVDWGGGGGKLRKAVKKDGEQQRMRTSFTTLAVMGITHQGQADVIWGTRSLRTHDWEWEARLCIEAIKKFRCTHLAHDFSNAGEGRLILIKQAGFPTQNILNMRYHGILHNRMQFMPATDDCPYPYYSLDKSQTLATTCMAIKYQLIRFFQDDYKSATTPGLLRDFLALIEEKIDSRIGTDNSFITRNPNMSDDFAQTVNYGAHALWWLSKKWPNFAAAARFRIAPGDIKHVHPVNPINWETM